MFNNYLFVWLIYVYMNDKVFLIAVELNSLSAVQKFECVLSSIGEFFLSLVSSFFEFIMFNNRFSRGKNGKTSIVESVL